jgi:uncharacterized protein YceK
MCLKPLLVLSLVVAAGALHSGCATVLKGTTQRVPIASEPAGASVIIDGQPAGTTPTKADLDRKHSHLISLELAGYEVENVPVINSVGGAVAGNILVGGLIGWGVDATTGAQYNLHPETVSVRLRPKGTAAATPASTFAAELAKLDELHTSKKLSDDEYTKMRAALVSTFEAAPKVESSSK